MIKKLKANWLSIALAIVVIFSLLLSGIIWTNPFQYEHPHRETSASQSKQFTTQSIGNLYLPTTVVKTNSKGNQRLMYSQKLDIVLKLQAYIKQWQLGHVSTVKTDNSDVYLSYLRRRNMLILSYPDEISGTVFNESFSQEIDANRVKHINHILIPLNGRKMIYLLSDYHYGIYRLRVNKRSLKNFQIKTKQFQPVAVNYKIINGKAILVYPHTFQLPMLGYQVSQQKIDSLSTNLIGSSRHTNTDDDKTTYTDGTNRRLVYNHHEGTVNYENDADQVSTNQLYSHFYNVLVKTGMPLNNLRFDESGNHGRTLIYRTYVEGFPIINDNGYGGAKLSAERNGVERYWLSLYTVQVPLPIKQQQVKLPSTTAVLNQLHGSSHFKDIKGLRVGYLWKTNENRVVKLVPTYFVKYRGNWVNYTEFTK